MNVLTGEASLNCSRLLWPLYFIYTFQRFLLVFQRIDVLVLMYSCPFFTAVANHRIWHSYSSANHCIWHSYSSANHRIWHSYSRTTGISYFSTTPVFFLFAKVPRKFEGAPAPLLGMFARAAAALPRFPRTRRTIKAALQRKRAPPMRHLVPPRPRSMFSPPPPRSKPRQRRTTGAPPRHLPL